MFITPTVTAGSGELPPPAVKCLDTATFTTRLMQQRELEETLEALHTEIERMIMSVSLGYQLASETSPGKLEYVELDSIVNVEELINFVSRSLDDIQEE